MRHNSAKEPAATAGQGELLEKMLSGSQAKTAFALRQNIERLLAGNSPLVLRTWRDGSGVERESWTAANPQNLNCAAFLTLTVGDEWDRAGALENRDKAEKRAAAAALKLAKGRAFLRVSECLRACGGADLRKLAGLADRLEKRAGFAERAKNEAYRVAALVPDDGQRHFVQVWDASEASRRINNLNRRLLPAIFERAVLVTERHKNKAIHFHVVGVLRGRPDIRTGFDFRAFKASRKAWNAGKPSRAADLRYKMAASDELRALWATLRQELPKFHFGRAELTPLEKAGESVAAYVSKYVEKNVCQRLPDDKRKKLVRYLGDWSTVGAVERPAAFSARVDMIEAAAAAKLPITVFAPVPAGCWKLRSNDFGWAGRRAWAWWNKAAVVAGLVGWKSTKKLALEIGPRWAWKLSGLWKEVTTDDLHPGFPGWTRQHRQGLTDGLLTAQADFTKRVVGGFNALRAWDSLARLADPLESWECNSFEPWNGLEADDAARHEAFFERQNLAAAAPLVLVN